MFYRGRVQAVLDPHEQLAQRIKGLWQREDCHSRKQHRGAGMRPEQFARHEKGEVQHPLLRSIVKIASGLGGTVEDLLRYPAGGERR